MMTNKTKNTPQKTEKINNMEQGIADRTILP
jgi:hypothetical protein